VKRQIYQGLAIVHISMLPLGRMLDKDVMGNHSSATARGDLPSCDYSDIGHPGFSASVRRTPHQAGECEQAYFITVYSLAT
jgi:hypothetical protein